MFQQILAGLLLAGAAAAGPPIVTNQPCLPPDLWYSPSEAILKPVAGMHLTYPQRARDSSQSGDVWLRVHVDDKGKVDSIGVFDDSNPGWGFDSCAIRATIDATFPKHRNGYWGYVPFAFIHDADELKTPSENCPVSAARGAPSTITTNPEMTDMAPPEYPRVAKQAGLEGTVWVKCLIGCMGQVLQVTVAKSSGAADLDRAATNAAWKNKFRPAMSGANFLPVWVVYRVQFTLIAGR